MIGSPPIVLPSAIASVLLGLVEILGGDEFAQEHRLASLIGELDPDGVAALHHGDAGGDRRHRPGDVVGEPDDARRLDARRRLQLVERHDGAGAYVDDLALDAEIFQHAFEQACVLLERILRSLRTGGTPRLHQHSERRHLPSAGRGSARRELRSRAVREDRAAVPRPAGSRARGTCRVDVVAGSLPPSWRSRGRGTEEPEVRRRAHRSWAPPLAAARWVRPRRKDRRARPKSLSPKARSALSRPR